MSQGTLFIISAPSGAGKTTILHQILATMDGIVFSVSHTTRQPRANERNGVDYHFIDRPTFEAMCAGSAFLEHAEVHRNHYGTSLQAVQTQLATGVDVILDIDVQGALQVQQSTLVHGVYVFILPPSLAALEQRLRQRDTDSATTIALRNANARREIEAIVAYDYVIVNDVLHQAVDTLRAIIVAERCRGRRSPAGQPLDLAAYSVERNDQ